MANKPEKLNSKATIFEGSQIITLVIACASYKEVPKMRIPWPSLTTVPSIISDINDFNDRFNI